MSSITFLSYFSFQATVNRLESSQGCPMLIILDVPLFFQLYLKLLFVLFDVLQLLCHSLVSLCICQHLLTQSSAMHDFFYLGLPIIPVLVLCLQTITSIFC